MGWSAFGPALLFSLPFLSCAMAIYTKRGDRGKTSLYSEKRRRAKYDQRIVAYGTIDELNSQLGLVSSLLTRRTRKFGKIITRIQETLFGIASELASPSAKKPLLSLGKEEIKELERLIDELEGKLPVLANFIFPGGGKAGAALHVSRSVCRRAEREAVRLSRREKVNENILVYLNRLSDALFMLARQANKLDNSPEKKWRGS